MREDEDDLDRLTRKQREARQQRRDDGGQQEEPPPHPGDGNGAAQQQAKRLRFPLEPFNTITVSRALSYLVKGVLPLIGLVVVWGPPKCGKSFLVYDLVMHVALGWMYRGRKVQAGTVVYIALEGGSGFTNRIVAWRQRHLADHKDPVPFHLLRVPLDLIAEHKALIADIRDQVGKPPTLIVIDTLNRSLNGSESKDEDMARYIRAADAVRVAFDCCVVVVHHCGIAKNRPRGHTSLAGADDVQIAVEKNKDGIITATVEHAKDIEAGARLASKLEQVDLGTDVDGDKISSLIIASTEAADVGPKLSKLEQLAFDALKRTLKDEGVEVKTDSAMAKAGVPIGQRACLSESWRQQFYELHQAKNPATKRQALFRATLGLEEAKLIRLVGQYIWLLAKHA
jgi:AAA domain